MSAFLGPIHKWLYGKILFQNEMADTIAAYAKEKGWMDQTIRVDRYGSLEPGKLEEIVDESNIHGWLQERVSLVENKLAYLVTTLTEEHPERMTEICGCMYEMGKKHQPIAAASAKSLYEYLETMLLNGMPCDHVNQLLETSEEKVSWKQTVNIHKSYWDMVHGDAENYDRIRASLIEGIIEKSGYQLKTEQDIYAICR